MNGLLTSFAVEFSPGGSDDGSGVVILLELLSNLVNDPLVTFTQVHLIVLFTSAEEMDFNGAEAFVRDHGWKNDIRRFINIDSTGGHEKAILFRVKPSQVVYFLSLCLLSQHPSFRCSSSSITLVFQGRMRM